MTTWRNFTGDDSTENVGRVWTDKTVAADDVTLTNNEGTQSNTISKDSDADFLVGLSALSSTSNVSTTTTSYQPLDIVLVLDVSGSMDNNINSYQYSETYNVNENGYTTYYALDDDGSYVEVDRITTGSGWYQRFDHWEIDGVEVTPMDNPSDTQSGHVQFYTRSTSRMTRLEALQDAAGEFINNAEQLNGRIPTEADKINISIVTFSNNADALRDLTTCEGQGAQSLRTAINRLEANGSTYSDEGIQEAATQLAQNGRNDADKVVVFFTDGYPGYASDAFDEDVANDAIREARNLKANGTTVYSVGIFNNADASSDPTHLRTDPDWYRDDCANRYMHAVSSNYPNASSYTNFGSDGDYQSGYYKSASTSDELTQVFEDIFNESSSSTGSGSPIEDVSPSGEPAVGTLNFEDQLGSYMEITPNTPMTLVYGDQEFTSNRGNASSDGRSVTYTFTGSYTANDVYDEADLSTIAVTVTKGDLATGDIVNISLPASFIPMRTYNVDQDEGTLSVTDAYPVRLFYNVSLKAAARDAVQNPTGGNAETYQAILSSQHDPTSDSISFLSNAWSSGVGTTTAQFTPNQANNFYYFTSDTPLYTDTACNNPANANDVETHDTLYYRTTYWESGDNGTTEVHNYGTVTSEGVTWSRINTSGDQAYIPAHTPRLDKPATMVTEKGEGNLTNTAEDVLSPAWVDNNTVQQNLGNNGELSYPKPGELEIKKTVDWGNASDSTKADKNSFTFTVDLKQVTTGEDGTETETDLTGSYPYAVYGASGDTPVSSGTIADDGTVTISADQRVVISGLPSGVRYIVTETVPNGFTVSDSSMGDGANTTDGIVAGAIVAGSQQSVSFMNTYHADSVNLSDANATLSVQKVLNGRDWRDSDTFKFDIAGAPGAPMPDETSVYVTDAESNHTASFGDITFEAPGTYIYTVSEDNDYQTIAGVNYSAARYTVRAICISPTMA